MGSYDTWFWDAIYYSWFKIRKTIRNPQQPLRFRCWGGGGISEKIRVHRHNKTQVVLGVSHFEWTAIERLVIK